MSGVWYLSTWDTSTKPSALPTSQMWQNTPKRWPCRGPPATPLTSYLIPPSFLWVFCYRVIWCSENPTPGCEAWDLLTTAGHCICFGENFIRLTCFSCPRFCPILHGFCTCNLGALLRLETSPKSRSPPSIRPRIHPRYLNTASATSKFSDKMFLFPTQVFRQILFSDPN